MSRHLILLLSLLMSVSLFAQPKKVKATAGAQSDWSTQVKKKKTDIYNLIKKADKPLETGVMKHKQPNVSMKVDVKGWDKLVLITDPTEDGTNYDHGVFGNAKLTAKDGSTVYLDELENTFFRSPYKTSGPNLNFSGKPVAINGKAYDHSIVLHSNGEVHFKLDKKYTQFETDLGVDDGATSTASVIFKVHNGLPNLAGEELRTKFPAEVASLERTMGMSIVDWLTSADMAKEENTLKELMKKLDSPVAVDAQLAEIEKTGSFADQSLTYVALVAKVYNIYEVQEELKWVNLPAIKLALDDMSKRKGFDAEANSKKYKEIADNLASVSKGIYSGDEATIAKGKRLLELKREILLANPLLDDAKIMTMRFDLGDRDRSAMADRMGMPSNNWSSMYSAARTGVKGEIAELSDIRGQIDQVKTKTIYKPEKAVNIADLQMHWNGKKMLFSSLDDKNKWQVYEVNTDGTGFAKKIKMGEPDLEFCDANYLPDGRIVASTNMGYQGVPCVDGSDQVGNLALYNPENGDFRRLTFDQDGNWNPVVMNNGRLMYTRWEYTDLTHYFSRIVMHMNPDGTENKELYGSGSFFPNSTFDIKPLPGKTSSFVGIISGHHGTARSGRLIIFDPSKSRVEEKGMVQEMPFKDRKIIPEVKDYLVDGVWPQFVRPQPISDEYFLVSAKLNEKGLWGIYLIDIYDNLTCIAQFEGEGLNAPLLVKEDKIPPVIPDRVNLADKEATVFIQDLYQGVGTEGVPKGTIKELRVFSYEYAYWNSPSDHHAQGIQSGWDIKRLLGTVPVEEDGSVLFKIPANMPISLQPLDDKGRAIQWFRSWFTAMPGENVSCIGCHEDQNMIVIPKRVTASQIKPHPLKEPEGGVRSFTFDLEIQPILDNRCVTCHHGDGKTSFEANRMDTMNSKRIWSKSYLNFMPYIYRQGAEAEMYVLKPYEYHASNSEMVRMLEKGHHGVELAEDEWKTLYAWIDMNAPYNGTFNHISKTADGFEQYERRMELSDKYSNVKIDWKQEIADYASHLKSMNKTAAPKPAKVERNYKKASAKNWPFDKSKAKEMQASKSTKMVEVAPGVEMKFVWVPAGEFVMGNNTTEMDCAPEFKAKVNKGFWMSENEVSNKQFTTLFPKHDSRHYGQFWKDHVHAGYPANKPEQPVIRVTYADAEKFCESMATKSGLKFTLPTETQWEWACRGGSAEPFWYGEMSTDFAKFENMADTQLSNMAVTGMDPQPMSKDHPYRKYWDYIPKISSVDDGQMLATTVGSYDANPWGLKDMHGNVAEWTRSDYVSYPIKNGQTNEHKVVRGGSWTDRPKYSASYYRKAFSPWQKAYNVGFRVIIEE